MSGYSTEDLRAAVREVIREVMPHGIPAGDAVSVSSDADLDALVRRVAALCEDPARRAAFQQGRHGFRLSGAPTAAVPAAAVPATAVPATAVPTAAVPATAVPPTAAGRACRDHDEGSRHARPAEVRRVERGAVTERTVLEAAKTRSRLVLGPRAVLTPLARDRARVLGVEIEKES